jgi:hypothetical protein
MISKNEKIERKEAAVPFDLRLSCECGREISVTEGSADYFIACACNRKIKVPPFRMSAAILAFHIQAECDDDNSPELPALHNICLCVVGTLFLGIALTKMAYATFLVAGSMFYLAGQVWLVYLIIKECHPEALLWTLLVPFFPWYFAFQRRDIAIYPFTCTASGLTLLLIGVS